jgi:hypothetical protein
VRHWSERNGEWAGNLRDLKPAAPKPAHGTFKAYEPGYLHVDIKYLPQMADEDLERTILRYVHLYNGKLPQAALKGRTPIDALKDWQRQRPELFRKRVYNHAGCDSYQPPAPEVVRWPASPWVTASPATPAIAPRSVMRQQPKKDLPTGTHQALPLGPDGSPSAY